jgi:hypothetical protein
MPRPSEPPERPGLDDGLRLLETEDRGRDAIHALVLGRALGEQSDVYWVDANAMASAQSLTTMAPTECVLESVQVSRAQTSDQRFPLVEIVRQLAQDDTALLVATGFDDVYTRRYFRAVLSGSEYRPPHLS